VVSVFDRFGLIRFEAVALERFGLQKKWRRLDKLQQEAEGLIGRYQEAAAEVGALEQGRQDARDKDLDAAAAALRKGDEVVSLEPEHEAALDKELSGAVRSRDALQRAVEGAMADVASYRLEHATTLQREISAALDAKAHELAEHARAAAALYAEVEDGRLVAKRLAPAQGAPENTGEPEDTTVLIGPMSTRTVSGPNRGAVEAVLNYLSSLAPTGSESEAEATTIVVGQ
jgi:hypothetical protein